ncbi:MAG: HEAT repeat domain-containing protein, partial [Candidatus Eremiobacteraeota bacterium]|nr:HEAT repeat domain-containing protein [Candidatus Eremiobacteraeota bacterium]
IHFPKALSAGERTTFAVAYRLEKPRAGLHFVAPTREHPEKPTQCWTQSQDEYARYWFPCLDYPHAKQTTSTTIVVPTGTFALGNGKLVERREDPATGYTTFRYVQDLPHSTYLVTMVAGAFTEVEQPGASVPVFYYVTPGREADGERSFGNTPAMVSLFEERTGMPYPYARYSQIAVADFIFGGMENTSATTQTDRTLHDERAHLDYSSDGLVAHELAHQWFGDLLTTRDWSHAWLNEGFATFFDAVFREHDLGRDEYLYTIYENVRTYVRETSERYVRPIVENRFRFPVEVFDRHLYEKGGAVVHMLRCSLGEARFWKAMRRYVAENAGRNVETIDWIRAIEAATGRNTRAFFDQWVFRAGHPDLRLSYEYDHAERSATIRVEQRQNISDEEPPYRLELDVGFLEMEPGAVERDSGPDPLVSERRHRFLIERGDQSFTFSFEQPPALVRVDPEAAILGTLEFALPTEMLTAIIASDPSPIARIRAAAALAKGPSPPALTALARALSDDPFWAVRAEVAKALGETRMSRAKELLIDACSDPHPKARRGVAEGLGNFRERDAADALIDLAVNDVSYFVIQTALESLGKTGDERALETLMRAVHQPSWDDTVASGAVRGLAELGGSAAVAAIVEATAKKNSDTLRAEAARALARIAVVDDATKGEAARCLAQLVDDDAFSVRRAVLQTVGKVLDQRLLGPLERIAEHPGDGRLRRSAAEAAAAIRGGLNGSARLGELQAQVDALRAECRTLRERMGV